MGVIKARLDSASALGLNFRLGEALPPTELAFGQTYEIIRETEALGYREAMERRVKAELSKKPVHKPVRARGGQRKKPPKPKSERKRRMGGRPTNVERITRYMALNPKATEFLAKQALGIKS